MSASVSPYTTVSFLPLTKYGILTQMSDSPPGSHVSISEGSTAPVPSVLVQCVPSPASAYEKPGTDVSEIRSAAGTSAGGAPL